MICIAGVSYGRRHDISYCVNRFGGPSSSLLNFASPQFFLRSRTICCLTSDIPRLCATGHHHPDYVRDDDPGKSNSFLQICGSRSK